MGDLISRQAVLEIVEREQNKGDALSEIEKLPSITPQEPQPKWIPVSERLPEKEGLYLVTVKRRLDYSFATNNYEYEFVVAIRRYTKGHGYSWGMRKSRVIAWMPLPEPYKPQESEE